MLTDALWQAGRHKISRKEKIQSNKTSSKCFLRFLGILVQIEKKILKAKLTVLDITKAKSFIAEFFFHF